MRNYIAPYLLEPWFTVGKMLLGFYLYPYTFHPRLSNHTGNCKDIFCLSPLQILKPCAIIFGPLCSAHVLVNPPFCWQILSVFGGLSREDGHLRNKWQHVNTTQGTFFYFYGDGLFGTALYCWSKLTYSMGYFGSSPEFLQAYQEHNTTVTLVVVFCHRPLETDMST